MKYGKVVQQAGGMWEMWYHCLGMHKIEQQRKKGKEKHHGLKRPHTNEIPHNNQPKISVWNSGEYGGEVWQAGGSEELWYHRLGHWNEQLKMNEHEIHWFSQEIACELIGDTSQKDGAQVIQEAEE